MGRTALSQFPHVVMNDHQPPISCTTWWDLNHTLLDMSSRETTPICWRESLRPKIGASKIFQKISPPPHRATTDMGYLCTRFRPTLTLSPRGEGIKGCHSSPCKARGILAIFVKDISGCRLGNLMSCPFRLAALIAASVNLKSKIFNWHVYC